MKIISRVAELSHRLGAHTSVNAGVCERVAKLYATEAADLLDKALDLCYAMTNATQPSTLTVWGAAWQAGYTIGEQFTADTGADTIQPMRSALRVLD